MYKVVRVYEQGKKNGDTGGRSNHVTLKLRFFGAARQSNFLDAPLSFRMSCREIKSNLNNDFNKLVISFK